MTFEVKPLDMPQGAAQAATPTCEHCGDRAWIVDGDGQGRFWLLCILHSDPITTTPLPDDFVVTTTPTD